MKRAVQGRGETMRFRVKELREKSGITADALAKRAGVSRMTIYHIEYHDNAVVKSDTLIAIARTLGVKVDDLIAE